MKNELAPKEEAALAKPLTLSDAPELQPVEEGDTLRIPRLLVVQDKYKGIKEGWAVSGELMNSLTKESYGTKVEIVAVYQRPLTRIRWAPRNAGGGQLCISRNKQKPSGDPGDAYTNCEQCQFYQDRDSETGCTMNYEIIALVVKGADPRFWEPILLTAESKRPTDAGIRNILENARYGLTRGVRMFHKPYVIGVTQASNKFGDFYKTQCAPGTMDGNIKAGALLPIDVIDYLDQQVKFYSQVNIEAAADPAHAAEATGAEGEPEVDAKTGAPKGW